LLHVDKINFTFDVNLPITADIPISFHCHKVKKVSYFIIYWYNFKTKE
jgi:hypothetical protein